MKISFVVFGLAVLVAVLVNADNERVSREELLDELTGQLLVRYLNRRNLDIDARYLPDYPPEQQGNYYKGPVRRWWGGHHSSSSTTNNQNAHNTGNINGNMINGGLSAGSITGSSQGRK